MIFNLLLFTLLSFVNCLELNNNPEVLENNYEIEISDNVLNIVYFFILSVVGLTLVFLGTKIARFTCFIFGFTLFFLISWLIVHKLEYLNQNQFLALFITCHLLGLFGGLFCYFIPVVALFSSGFLLLASLLNLILCLASLNLIALGWIIIVSISALFGGISIIYPKFMFPLSSSVLGTQLFLIGIDLYVKLGLIKFFQSFYFQKFINISNNHALQGILASLIPVGLLGFIIQYKLFNYEDGKNFSRRKATWSTLPKLPTRTLTNSSSSPMISTKNLS